MNLYRLTYLLPFLLHTTFISFFCQGAQLLHQWNRPTLLNKKQLVNQIGKGIRLTRSTFSTHLVEQPTKTYRDNYWLNRCTMTWPFFGKKNPEKINNAFLRAAEKGNLRKLTKALLKGANVYTTDQKDNNALHYASMYASNDKAIHWLIDIAYLYIESQNKYQRTPFLCAAKKGNLPALKLLKEKGANVKKKDKKGSNALHLAAAYAPEGKGIAWLIDTADINIESKGNHQKTAFLFAAEKGNLAALEVLHKKGANLNFSHQKGYNALHYAAVYAPDGKGIAWLIDTAKINIESKANNQRTAFLFAAEKGNLDTLKILKEKGAQVDVTDYNGNNALHLAASYAPKGKGIGWLLNTCNLLVDFKNKYGVTPFLCAAEKGNLPALKILQVKGANLNATNQNGNNALHYAAALFASEGKGIAWLIDIANIDIESRGSYQKTAFLFAAEKGNLEALKILKAKGSSLYATDQYGNNALHYAALYAPEGKGIAWLIDTAKIDIESRGNYQRTAFLCAAENGNLSALKILQQKGANLKALDQYGNNALHYAALYALEGKGIAWLIDTVKIDIEFKGRYQRTAFLCAAEKGNLSALKILKEKGANINAKDQNGKNALALAKKYSADHATIDWLEKELNVKEKKNILSFFRK